MPHFECWEKIQCVTFRLGDSLPAAVAGRLAHEKDGAKGETAYRKRIEAALDAGHGACHLRRPEIAAIVRDSLLCFDGARYWVHAWVIMPNHVHVLFQPISPHTLSRIVKGWKAFTAREINRVLNRSGELWQEEYWDRFMRDEEHYARTVAYIRENPVKADLAARPEDWPWSGCASG